MSGIQSYESKVSGEREIAVSFTPNVQGIESVSLTVQTPVNEVWPSPKLWKVENLTNKEHNPNVRIVLNPLPELNSGQRVDTSINEGIPLAITTSFGGLITTYDRLIALGSVLRFGTTSFYEYCGKLGINNRGSNYDLIAVPNISIKIGTSSQEMDELRAHNIEKGDVTHDCRLQPDIAGTLAKQEHREQLEEIFRKVNEREETLTMRLSAERLDATCVLYTVDKHNETIGEYRQTIAYVGRTQMGLINTSIQFETTEPLGTIQLGNVWA